MVEKFYYAGHLILRLNCAAKYAKKPKFILMQIGMFDGPMLFSRLHCYYCFMLISKLVASHVFQCLHRFTFIALFPMHYIYCVTFIWLCSMNYIFIFIFSFSFISEPHMNIRYNLQEHNITITNLCMSTSDHLVNCWLKDLIKKP